MWALSFQCVTANEPLISLLSHFSCSLWLSHCSLDCPTALWGVSYAKPQLVSQDFWHNAPVYFSTCCVSPLAASLPVLWFHSLGDLFFPSDPFMPLLAGVFFPLTFWFMLYWGSTVQSVILLSSLFWLPLISFTTCLHWTNQEQVCLFSPLLSTVVLSWFPISRLVKIF